MGKDYVSREAWMQERESRNTSKKLLSHGRMVFMSKGYYRKPDGTVVAGPGATYRRGK